VAGDEQEGRQPAAGGAQFLVDLLARNIRQADVAVVNTCGFIEEAKVESIETILKLCELKKKGKLGQEYSLMFI